MLTALGVLLILAAIGLSIAKLFIPSEDEINQQKNRRGYYDPSLLEHPFFQQYTQTKKLGGMALFGALLFLVGFSNFYAKEGHKYYVLSPFGTKTVISSPGFKIVFPFSKVQEWEKYIDIKCVERDKNTGEYLQSTEGIEGVIDNGVGVRFIDKVTADVYLAVRFEIPTDDVAFIKLVETYRHPKNLVNNTLIPTIVEQLTNVTFMYSAEDYVSGGATDYKMTIEDALKNGGFVVKKVEVSDTLFVDEVFTVDSLLTKPRKIQEVRSYVKNEKIFENGIPKRVQHEINVNKIITAQVIVSDVKLESSFENKLTQQRDISAEKIIEIQKIETAKAAQQRILAEGERDKSAERVAQEKAQVAKLISIETQVKEEESKRQLAEINVKTEELKAKALKIEADAISYQNSKLVQAGLTPQEKAECDYQTKIGIAKVFKNMSTPQIVINGSSNSSGDLTNSLIQAEMAKRLLLDK
jgi:hypothetical protein